MMLEEDHAVHLGRPVEAPHPRQTKGEGSAGSGAVDETSFEIHHSEERQQLPGARSCSVQHCSSVAPGLRQGQERVGGQLGVGMRCASVYNCRVGVGGRN